MITKYYGDMLKQLANVEDDSVDLLLTDPPYNISKKGAKPVWTRKNEETGESVNLNTIHSQRFDETFSEKWDDFTEEEFLLQIKSWARAWFPKIKKGGSFAIFISDRYVSYLWSAMEESGFEPKRIWTWKKPAAVPFNRKVNPVSGAEYILWGIKPGGKRTFNSDAKKGTMIHRYSIADKVSNILYKHIRNDLNSDLEKCFKSALSEAKRVQKSLKTTGDIAHCIVPNTITYSGGLGKNKIHPTEKPQEILQYFIELCSNPGDKILDTFAGSGSTGIASKKLRRDCILIERDSKMYSKMITNLQNAGC